MSALHFLPDYVRSIGPRPVAEPVIERRSRKVPAPVAVPTRVPDSASDAAVTVSDLQVDRGGNPVLRDVSLTLPRGSVTGLLGPSGCGKSTLIRSVMGIQRIAGGNVTVLGQPAGSPELRSRIGYVTQAPALYGDLTVGENLDYFARLLDVRAGRVDEVLAIVDLVHVRKRLTGVLSGGQRARVSLAAALLGEPELLVLDEPTVGLDPVVRRSLWRTFEELAAGGTTLLVSSHVMDEAARCDVVLLMRDGTIMAAESPRQLQARTGASDMEEAFLRLAGEVA